MTRFQRDQINNAIARLERIRDYSRLPATDAAEIGMALGNLIIARDGYPECAAQEAAE